MKKTNEKVKIKKEVPKSLFNVNNIYSVLKLYINKILVIILITFIGFLILANHEVDSTYDLTSNGTLQNKQAQSPINTPTATIIPTQIPKITPKQQQKIYVVPTVDPDPVIKCKAAIGSKCEGQYLTIRKRECLTVLHKCCQIGNLWKMMTVAECNLAQSGGSNKKYEAPKLVLPTFAPIVISTLTPYPTIAPFKNPPQTYDIDYSKLLRDCINQAYAEYNHDMGILNSLNTGDSSEGVKVQSRRDSNLQACHEAYDINY